MSLDEFTYKELEKIRKAAMQVTLDHSIKKEVADTESHIGGKPYFIKGDVWPICPVCKDEMNFFMQLRELDQEKNVSLKTFFNCNCTIKEYKPQISINEYLNPQDELIDEEGLSTREYDDYVAIKLRPSWSAPAWSFLQGQNQVLYEEILRTFENQDDAEAYYDEQRLFNDYLPEDPFTSLFGYPEFFSDPLSSVVCGCCRQYTEFYFQIDSMPSQNINWNDGTLYCYRCPNTKTYFFLVN